MPPVTCAPGLVSDGSGKCGCTSGLVLTGGKCERPTLPPTRTAAPRKATPPPAKKCLANQKLVNGACTDAPTLQPIVVVEGYCPRGLIQQPNGECVCPPGLVRNGDACGCDGQLQLINGKCGCANGLVQKGSACEKIIQSTPKPTPRVIATAATRPPSK